MERETTLWKFQAKNWSDWTRGDMDMAKKGYIEGETELFLKAAQNNR